MFESAVLLARAEGELVGRHVARLLLHVGALATILLVGVAGAVAFGAGAVILAAPHLGLAGALLLVGAVTLAGAAGIGVWLLKRSGLLTDRKRTAQKIMDARKQLEESAEPPERPGNSTPESSRPSHDPIGAALANPARTASAVFAVAGVLGIGRTIRLLRVGAGLASAATVVAQLVEQQAKDSTSNKMPSHTTG